MTVNKVQLFMFLTKLKRCFSTASLLFQPNWVNASITADKRVSLCRRTECNIQFKSRQNLILYVYLPGPRGPLNPLSSSHCSSAPSAGPSDRANIKGAADEDQESSTQRAGWAHTGLMERDALLPAGRQDHEATEPHEEGERFTLTMD